jgi:hypothetical protein
VRPQRSLYERVLEILDALLPDTLQGGLRESPELRTSVLELIDDPSFSKLPATPSRPLDWPGHALKRTIDGLEHISRNEFTTALQELQSLRESLDEVDLDDPFNGKLQRLEALLCVDEVQRQNLWRLGMRRAAQHVRFQRALTAIIGLEIESPLSPEEASILTEVLESVIPTTRQEGEEAVMSPLAANLLACLRSITNIVDSNPALFRQDAQKMLTLLGSRLATPMMSWNVVTGLVNRLADLIRVRSKDLYDNLNLSAVAEAQLRRDKTVNSEILTTLELESLHLETQALFNVLQTKGPDDE